MSEPDSNGPVVGDLYRPSAATDGEGTEPRRGPRVLVVLHDDCVACRRWRRTELDPAALEMGEWGGRIVTTTPVAGAPPSEAWVAVVDEWDQVFHVARIGPGHTFPDPADLLEWVRFVAIQCEECEGPEGPWRP